MSASTIRGIARSRNAILRTTVVIGACAPVLAGCATGFGAPTRHAVANLQAASVDVGHNLLVRGLIVALPNGTSADKGGVAYIEFTAINQGDQPDELQNATATAESSGSAAASASATSSDVASQVSPVGTTKIPAKSARTPGVARITVELKGLTQQISQGDSLKVSLQFANSGSANDIDVPVEGSDVVGSSFLPSGPVSAPASPSPGQLVSQSPAVNSPAVSGSPSPASSS